MNNKSAVFLIFLLTALFLSFNNSSIKAGNKTGEEFKIRTGVNVSHWLSQSSKHGEERERYIVQADFDTIASGGFDHVRIPVDEMQLWDEEGNKEKEAFTLLHNAIQWAIEADLRVIVDLHIIRSHYFNAEEKPLFTDPKEQEKLVDIWIQLSKELIKYPNSMVAYEILNEAVADDPEDWNKIIDKVVTAIRKKEPERKIVIGSNRWQGAETFPDLKVPENDKNIILSFHFYTPMAFTHYKAPWMAFAEYERPVNYPGQIADTSYYEDLSEEAVNAMRDYANGYFTKEKLEEIMMPAIKTAKAINLPLYCGEYGSFPTIPLEQRLIWYKDVVEIFNKHSIAYCHWGYKGDFPVVDENNVLNRKLTSVLTTE